MCFKEVMEVLEDLLDFHWTWTVWLNLLLESKQHVDLKVNNDTNSIIVNLRKATFTVVTASRNMMALYDMSPLNLLLWR